MPVPISNLTATFSDAGYRYTAFGMNVTYTAAEAGSRLFEIRLNNDPKFWIGLDGIPSSNISSTDLVAKDIAVSAFDKANAIPTIDLTGVYATIDGANTAVGSGANAFTTAAIASINTTVGAGANSFAAATVAGANSISIAAFNAANAATSNTINVNAFAISPFANVKGNTYNTNILFSNSKSQKIESSPFLDFNTIIKSGTNTPYPQLRVSNEIPFKNYAILGFQELPNGYLNVFSPGLYFEYNDHSSSPSYYIDGTWNLEDYYGAKTYLYGTYNHLEFGSIGGSVSLEAPSDIDLNYTLILPYNKPEEDGQVLTGNSQGYLLWTSPINSNTVNSINLSIDVAGQQANSFTSATIAGANNYFLSTIAGANNISIAAFNKANNSSPSLSINSAILFSSGGITSSSNNFKFKQVLVTGTGGQFIPQLKIDYSSNDPDSGSILGYNNIVDVPESPFGGMKGPGLFFGANSVTSNSYYLGDSFYLRNENNPYNFILSDVVSEKSRLLIESEYSGIEIASNYLQFSNNYLNRSITIFEPDTIAVSYSLTLPQSLPTYEQVLTADNSGQLYWSDLVSIGTVNFGGAQANTFAIATITGANTAVGTGANNFLLRTISGANTTVGTGANNYLLATMDGANTAVGAGANNYLLATMDGANAAIGIGANTISIAAFIRANSSINAIANANGVTTFPGPGPHTVYSTGQSILNFVDSSTVVSLIKNDVSNGLANVSFRVNNVLPNVRLQSGVTLEGNLTVTGTSIKDRFEIGGTGNYDTYGLRQASIRSGTITAQEYFLSTGDAGRTLIWSGNTIYLTSGNVSNPLVPGDVIRILNANTSTPVRNNQIVVWPAANLYTSGNISHGLNRTRNLLVNSFATITCISSNVFIIESAGSIGGTALQQV